MSINIPLIFSGFNSRAVLAYIRTLEEDNVEYAIIAKSAEDEIFQTIYKKNVIAVRDKIELDLEDIFSCIEKVKTKYKEKVLVVAPSTEALNRFLLDNVNSFKKRFDDTLIIPLVEKKIYELVSDKEKFSNLCDKNGIRVPNQNNFSIPYVAKPKKYNDLEPQLILNPKQEKDFQNIFSTRMSEFYFQEYIEGESFYLLYYFSKNKLVYKLSQKNLVQQPNGKHIVAAVNSNIENSEVSIKFEKMFKEINFVGLVMVEIIKKDDQYFMIEANPRFWGPSQLMVDSKVNLFKYFNFDNQITDSVNKISVDNSKVKYFWKEGYFKFNPDELKFYIDRQEFIKELDTFIEVDLYNRSDMLE